MYNYIPKLIGGLLRLFKKNRIFMAILQFKKFKKTKAIYIMFFTAIIILFISGTIVVKQLNTRFIAGQWVTHTYQVINKIDSVFLQFMEAERQFQFFVNTHNNKNLALYHNALIDTQKNVSEVRLSTNDNKSEQNRIDQIEIAINNLLSNTPNRLNKANLLPNLANNEQNFSKITTLVHGMSAEELSLLKQRTQQFEKQRLINNLEILVIILLGFLILIFAFLAIIKLAKKNEQQYLRKQELEQEKLVLQETLRIELEFSLSVAKQGFWNLNLSTLTAERSLLHDQIFGYSSLLPEWTYEMFLGHVHPDDHLLVTQSFKNSTENNLPWEFQCRIYRADDHSLHWISVSGKILQLGDSKHLLGVIQDITDRKQMETLLLESEERWKFALENAHHGVWDWYVPEKIIYYSHYWKNMLGYQDDEIKNEQYEFESRVHPDDLEKVFTRMNDHFEGKTSEYLCEVRFRCKNGSYKWILDRGKVISRSQDGTVLRAIGTHTDISDFKENETNLKHLAEHDALTGLINRAIFEDRLEQAILLAKRKKSNFAVFFLDIDGFKQINDIYGHMTGDSLLRATASRLQECIREMDSCARYGGDEFILLLQEIKDKSVVIKIAQEIIHHFSKNFVIDNKELSISVSIGISMYPKDGDQSLIEKADSAMYYVKKHEKNNFKLFN